MRVGFLGCLVVAVCAAVASACGYDDRSYDDVSFACDSAHPCPQGARCVAGRCTSTGAGSGNVGRQGVQCGATFCNAGSACCDDIVSPLYCASFGVCAGKELRCDGQEDCTGGTSCCLEGATSICLPTCPTLELCSSNADCAGNPDGAFFCCPFPALDQLACRPISC